MRTMQGSVLVLSNKNYANSQNDEFREKRADRNMHNSAIQKKRPVLTT